MNKRLLLATAAVAITTSAFAQPAPSTSNSNNSVTQQKDSSSTTPSSSTPTTSPSQSTNPSSSSNSAQTQTPPSNYQNAGGSASNSGTTSSQPSTSSSSPNQTQSNSPSHQVSPNSTPNQAQTSSPPSGQAQSANPSSSSSNSAQQPQNGSGSTNTAQQPNRAQDAAKGSSPGNVNASVNINDQQRTRISQSVSHLNVQPLTSVNFSVSVGTVVPRDVRLQPLPAEVVEVAPQYRGYDFVVVKDEIVIVEPSSYKIVAVLPYSGHSTAAAPARTEQRKTTFTDRDRDVIRKHVKARPVEREHRTTSSSVRTEIRTGERVPEGIEIEAFPEEVYREAPSLREYRYIHRDSHTYVVEPHDRQVIEEID